jgi:hypothetical protein
MEDKNITGLESISSELEAQLEIYLKIFALLYADDTVLMSETSDGLQTLLNISPCLTPTSLEKKSDLLSL